VPEPVVSVVPVVAVEVPDPSFVASAVSVGSAEGPCEGVVRSSVACAESSRFVPWSASMMARICCS